MQEQKIIGLIHKFIRYANPKDIQAEFRRNRSARESKSINSYHVDIDYEGLDRIAPTWLNQLGFVEELVSFGIPEFWDNLVKHQGGLNVELTRLVRAYLFNPFHTSGIKSPGQAIEFSNHFFFTRTIVLIGMAALLGEQFDEALRSDVEHNSPYEASKVIAQSFKTPAHTPHELLTRMEFLFQPAESKVQGAYSTLRQYGAFIEEHKNCPAQDMTQVIFETYGEMLREKNYKKNLLNRITS